MSTTTSQIVPLDVYLHSSYEPDAEYVDGEIQLRPMGEFDHSTWQLAVQSWFLQHSKQWNIRVRPELRIQVSASRFRVPDVTILDRTLPIEQIITHPPLAVFEILSPEDTLQRLKRKLEDYRLMGIPEIRVIDPQDGAFYRWDGQQLLRDDAFAIPAKGIAFDMHRISESLD
jgi:Uma2 family endonuclease